MAYYIIYYYNYVENLYVIAWIILGILILSLQLTIINMNELKVGGRMIENKTQDFKTLKQEHPHWVRLLS